MVYEDGNFHQGLNKESSRRELPFPLIRATPREREMLGAWVAAAMGRFLGTVAADLPPANGWSAGDLVCLSVQQENELPSTAGSPAPLCPLPGSPHNPQLFQLREQVANSASHLGALWAL